MIAAHFAAPRRARNRKAQSFCYDRSKRRLPINADCNRERAQDAAEKLGSGAHGGDPDSVKFGHRIGLDYVSCSPSASPSRVWPRWRVIAVYRRAPVVIFDKFTLAYVSEK